MLRTEEADPMRRIAIIFCVSIAALSLFGGCPGQQRNRPPLRIENQPVSHRIIRIRNGRCLAECGVANSVFPKPRKRHMRSKRAKLALVDALVYHCDVFSCALSWRVHNLEV